MIGMFLSPDSPCVPEFRPQDSESPSSGRNPSCGAAEASNDYLRHDKSKDEICDFFWDLDELLMGSWWLQSFMCHRLSLLHLWDSGRDWICETKINKATIIKSEINKRTYGLASHPSFYICWADSGEAFCFRPSIRRRDWQSETVWSDDSAADRRPDWLELAGCGALQAQYHIIYYHININRQCVLTEVRYV